MSWKNLRFHPPILKIKWCDLRLSQLVLMRVQPNLTKTFIGCFLLAPEYPDGYVFTMLGDEEQLFLSGVDELIEWTEVPE